MRLPSSIACLAATICIAGNVQAQFAPTGTTSVSVTVAAEASLQVNTATTTLTSSGIFGGYTGTTSLTYKIRTTQSTGSGSITLKVTSDFTPSGVGPSVGSPLNGGDTLTYTCTVSSPGTGCASAQTSSTASSTTVGTFGSGANSTAAGNSASVSWTLVDDPAYKTGSYAATVTFTVSST
jgi:hypothetical protein